MNDRLRIAPAIAYEAGREDARQLISDLCDPAGEMGPAVCLVESLSEIIGLAVDLRTEEAAARLEGFASIIAPMLAEPASWRPVRAAPELTTTETEGGEL